MKKWNFMQGQYVYLYPSANADDGGNVNSESNVTKIVDGLMDKSFVIKKPEDQTHLEVVLSTDKRTINVLKGSALIRGYYSKFESSSTSNYIITGLDPFSDEYFTATELREVYQEEFMKSYEKYYDTSRGATPWTKDARKKEVDVPQYSQIAGLHIVIKLIKNVTGNLRGDLLEKTSAGSTLVCKGAALSILTKGQMDALTVPYIDLGKIIFDPTSNPSNNDYKIQDIYVPETTYSRDNSNSVYVNIYNDHGDIIDQMLLLDYLEDLINKKLKRQDSISKYVNDDEGDSTVRETTLSVKDRNTPKDNHGDVFVTRYVPDKSKGYIIYDDEGNAIVNEIPPAIADINRNGIQDYEETYSIDSIQRRTHISSKLGVTYNAQASYDSDEFNNAVAKDISTLDNVGTDDGAGHTACEVTSPANKSTQITNGKSRLLARADHNHDTRYILSKNSCDVSSTEQEIGTKLKVAHKLTASEELEVVGKGTFDNIIEVKGTGKSSFEGPVVINSTASGTDSNAALEVKGTITGSKVYNAVWNDYAELYKKHDESVDYEPGTVICKVPGEMTYTASTYINRKLVVGVVSDTYGHLLGGDADLSLEENLKLYVPVAVSGRVYVKVAPHCTIEEGDLLSVSGFEGRVVSSPSPSVGTIVGKALEPASEGNPKDKILMQVMLA